MEGHRGLSIELLIDGQSLAGIVGFEDTLIPYYLFEGDLPLGYWGEDDPSIRCVAICICGNIGCGNSECRVVREGDVVVFRDFGGSVNPKHERKGKDGREFRVTAINYDSVLADIMKEVADYQSRI
jgi:hypothetical protein